ncbi:MAG: tRNA guanosine(34) transglycosylase Tgt [Patescibacteria group bacterium]
MFEFEILKKDRRTNARAGVLKTPHGTIETPSYVVVGTHGAVRCLDSEDISKTKTQLIISNTYHLWRTLGEKLESFPGLHEFMWNGPIMTDSGGFQVFSLGFGREHGMGKFGGIDSRKDDIFLESEKNLVRVTEDGAHFNDDYGESYLDAEKSVAIQEKLGADIIVAFDEPTSPRHDYAYTKKSLERTHKWALRSLKARTRKDQAMYGVVQGGAFRDLREASAKFIGAQPFEGFAIGGSYGESMGAPREQMLSVIRWSAAHLPEEKPRHLLGIGKIEDVFDAVELGMDTFDCVIPTREARHGSLWTKFGRLDIKKGIWQGSHMKIQGDCPCPVCSEVKLTRGKLRELFKAKNQSAGRLATMHNIFFFNNLLEKIRMSIKEGRFPEFKKEFLANL